MQNWALNFAFKKPAEPAQASVNHFSLWTWIALQNMLTELLQV
jgi:hypothetical protein